MSVSYIANIYEISNFKLSNGFNELRVYARHTLKQVAKDQYSLVEDVKVAGIKIFSRPVSKEVITITQKDFSQLNGKMNHLYFYNLRQTKIYDTHLFDFFKERKFHVDLLKQEGKELTVLNRGVNHESFIAHKGMPYSTLNLIYNEMARRLERLELPETGLDRFTPYVIAGICLFGGIGFVILFKSGLDQIIVNLDNIRRSMGMVV